ncbi:MAG: fibronectin type III domain-containing protein [Candidatus Bilamarchaeaceae archaeon]
MIQSRGLLFVGALLALALLFGCVGASVQNVSAKPVSGGIMVSWSPSSQADVAGYNVYRGTAKGELGPKLNPVLIKDVGYKDSTAQNGETYYYTVRAVDSKSNEDGGNSQVSATAQTSPPSNLQIQINGGKQYANSQSVTLYLSAQGASQCRFSNDANTWSQWEPYAQQKQWSLSQGDGQKTVYYQCEDAIGNTAMPVSAGITLDTQAPTLVISSPKEGGSYPTQLSAVIMVSDSLQQRVSCSGSMDGVQIGMGYVDSDKETTVQFSGTPGAHTLTVTCNDGINSISKSVSFTITDQPQLSMHIESGSGYVAQRNVYLDLQSQTASQCRFSNDGRTWGNWVAYSARVPWSLSPGDGTKAVYAQCQDKSGTVSDTVSDDVILDSKPPPYMSLTINNGAAWTNSQYVTLGMYCFAGAQYRLSNDDLTWTGWMKYNSGVSWTLSSGTGTKYVYLQCQDSNGNTLGTQSASITYSQVQPNAPAHMTIKINNGVSYTSSRNVALSLYADYANECRYMENGQDWTGWMSYTTSKSWTLTDQDGKHSIQYQCRNDFGSNSVTGSIYLDRGSPDAVKDLSASADSSSIFLRWSAPSGNPSSYNVYRRSGGDDFRAVGSASSVSYTDRNVQAGTTYYYMVRALSASGNEGPGSNVVSAVVDTSPPSPPLGLTAQATPMNSINLAWSPPSSIGGGIKHYNIYRSNKEFGMISYLASTTDTNYVDGSVSMGSSYAYWVTAVDYSDRESDKSSSADAECCLVLAGAG